MIEVEQTPGVTSSPSPGTWAHCHPTTRHIFKASLTCPNGHGMILKGHSINRFGVVSPSVVCPRQGCNFHEFVKLKGWNGGDL